MAVFVLHLGRLEHFVALSLLACVFVIAWVVIDLRLLEVGVEVARVGAVAHVDGEIV